MTGYTGRFKLSDDKTEIIGTVIDKYISEGNEYYIVSVGTDNKRELVVVHIQCKYLKRIIHKNQ